MEFTESMKIWAGPTKKISFNCPEDLYNEAKSLMELNGGHHFGAFLIDVLARRVSKPSEWLRMIRTEAVRRVTFLNTAITEAEKHEEQTYSN